MQRLLWIGQPCFARELEALGLECTINYSQDQKIPLVWQDILQICGFAPDMVVVCDDLPFPRVLGQENFPALTIFYSNNPDRWPWPFAYAQGFDACMAGQYNQQADFCGPFLGKDRIWWFPPFASNRITPKSASISTMDILFAGQLDPVRMPKRSLFLNKLKERLPGLQIRANASDALFQEARIVLNHVENGELNFPVFEVMANGACLVTPRVNNGLEKLFVDGEEMVAYAPDDPGDAAYRIEFLLANPDLCAYIGKTAQEKANSEHRATHRAQAFMDYLLDLASSDLNAIVQTRRMNAAMIRQTCLSPLYEGLAATTCDESLHALLQKAARGEL